MMINKSSTMSTNISRDPAEARMKPSTPPHEYPSPCLTPSATGDQAVPIRARRIFLLSPANIRGIRGSQITSDGMPSSMAVRLRNQGVPLGEIFSFISGLYFRGKLAYAEKFAEVTRDVRPAYVITASAGLIPCETMITLERLRESSAGEVDPANEKYRGPLDRDSAALSGLVGTTAKSYCLAA